MTKTLRTAALAAIMISGVSGVALADCPAQPKPPAIPADGAKLTSKEIDAVVKDYDAYQKDFQKFNECVVKEYKAADDAMNAVIDAYQSKNKKK
ncbi:MAG: hypothetical protein K1X51_02370 [Rhodospirillaceae bacterium]|nr:hypothetical protein [Rhodospirillaceae bacterium]